TKVNEFLYLYQEEGYYDVVVGAIVLPNKLIAIDSGINIPGIEKFREYVEAETNKKFEMLLITHHHLDHILGNQIFSDCKIVASKSAYKKMVKEKETWTAERIEQTKSMFENPTFIENFTYTIPTEGIDYLEIEDDGVKVIFKKIGGHTDDSAYVYCSEYKLLFTGDNLFFDLFPAGQETTSDPEVCISFLKEILDLDIDYYIPGHQSICNEEIIKQYIHFIESLKNAIIDLHNQGKTKEEIIAHCETLSLTENSPDYPSLSGLKMRTLENWYNYWIKK
ncbi:MAG: MBL fold metallo-hydrolase, partial [Candidatus Heimdallarchaeota archaeon]